MNRNPIIYQLALRCFGNLNATNAFDGDLATNGSGKFDDINDTAIAAIAELVVTHVRLTGILRQNEVRPAASLE